MHDPQNVRELAETLAQQPPPPGTDLEPHIDAWARESVYTIARDFVCRELTATDSKNIDVSAAVMVCKANTLARQRLVLAAWRLATLLN